MNANMLKKAKEDIVEKTKDQLELMAERSVPKALTQLKALSDQSDNGDASLPVEFTVTLTHKEGKFGVRSKLNAKAQLQAVKDSVKECWIDPNAPPELDNGGGKIGDGKATK